MRKLIVIIFLLATIISCSKIDRDFDMDPSKLKKDLRMDPSREEFLSLVRYIVLEEEIDMYKEYPLLEREEYIEQFWARRDPKPFTVRNEFKEEYFRRIWTANELFRGSIAGWLQDRGRIFILFGPPDEMQVYPLGENPFMKPMEKWTYYKFFTSSQAAVIYFVDTYNTGNYKLATSMYDFNPGYPDTLKTTSITYLHDINKQEAIARRSILQNKAVFNFKWNFIKKRERKEKRNLLIHIEMPYNRIVFSQREDWLESYMELFIEIRNANQIFIWDFNETYNLSFTLNQFKVEKEGKLSLNIPITLWLDKGKYSVYIHLSNIYGNQEVKKLLKLKM